MLPGFQSPGDRFPAYSNRQQHKSPIFRHGCSMFLQSSILWSKDGVLHAYFIHVVFLCLAFMFFSLTSMLFLFGKVVRPYIYMHFKWQKLQILIRNYSGPVFCYTKRKKKWLKLIQMRDFLKSPNPLMPVFFRCLSTSMQIASSYSSRKQALMDVVARLIRSIDC